MFLLLYILCLAHLIYRVKTGGKHPEIGPREYLNDERCQAADWVSCLGTIIGTIIIAIGIL